MLNFHCTCLCCCRTCFALVLVAFFALRFVSFLFPSIRSLFFVFLALRQMCKANKIPKDCTLHLSFGRHFALRLFFTSHGCVWVGVYVYVCYRIILTHPCCCCSCCSYRCLQLKLARHSQLVSLSSLPTHTCTYIRMYTLDVCMCGYIAALLWCNRLRNALSA